MTPSRKKYKGPGIYYFYKGPGIYYFYKGLGIYYFYKGPGIYYFYKGPGNIIFTRVLVYIIFTRVLVYIIFTRVLVYYFFFFLDKIIFNPNSFSKIIFLLKSKFLKKILRSELKFLGKKFHIFFFSNPNGEGRVGGLFLLNLLCS